MFSATISYTTSSKPKFISDYSLKKKTIVIQATRDQLIQDKIKGKIPMLKLINYS